MSDRRFRRRDLLAGATALSMGLAGCSTASTEPTEGSDPTEPDASTTAAPETTASTATATEDPERTEDSERSDGDDAAASRKTVGITACSVPTWDDCGDPETISGDVTADRTLGGDCSVYRVTDWLNVRPGANLAIEPGTKLEFAQGAGLYVQGSGSLSAVGTCEAPILMTGDQPLPGTWNGIWFDASNRVENELAFCRVEYGGTPEVGANLLLDGECRLEAHDCTFTHAEGANFYFDGYVTVPDFSNNVVTASEGVAGFAWPSNLQYLDRSGTYTGNADDYVEVPTHNVDADFEGTWAGIDVPYRFTPNSTSEVLWMDGDLTIEPSATLEFEQDTGLTVSGTLVTNPESGPFGEEAVDDEAKVDAYTVRFVGVESTPGYWRGLAFEGSDSRRNQLGNVLIAGGAGYEARYAAVAANLSVVDGSRVYVTDSIISNRAAYGIYMGPGANTTYVNNQVVGHRKAPVWTTANAAWQVNSSLENLARNGEAAVVVRGGSGSGYAGAITGDDNWRPVGVPYRVVPTPVDGELRVTGSLTVEPGTTIGFSEGTDLRASETGSITSSGTAEDPIRLTGTEARKGHWGGLFFVDSGSTENVVEYTTVEYAGAYAAPFSGDTPAAIGISRDGGAATIENTVVRSIPGVGIVRERISEWTLFGNRFEDVDGADTHVHQTP